MPEEIITTTPPVEAPKVETPSQERIKQLSDKVELTSKERDELKTLNETTTRERDFYKGFADVLGTQPEAKNHQDEIKEKVLKGYTVQDATYAVLGGLGKIGGNAPVQTQVAGGSADTTITHAGNKTPAEMTQAERRAELEKVMVWQ